MTDSAGHPVLDTNGNAIVLDRTYRTSKLGVDQYGNLTYPDNTGNQQNIGVQIGLAKLPERRRFDQEFGFNYLESDASGQATIYNASQLGSLIKSGYLRHPMYRQQTKWST